MAGLELRPHHLLCLRFFVGHGYSPAFAAVMGELQAHLRTCPETPLTLRPAPDGLCARCPNLQGAECESGKPGRYDRAVLALCGLKPGATLSYGALSRLVEECILVPGLLGQVCGDCQWSQYCGG